MPHALDSEDYVYVAPEAISNLDTTQLPGQDYSIYSSNQLDERQTSHLHEFDQQNYQAEHDEEAYHSFENNNEDRPYLDDVFGFNNRTDYSENSFDSIPLSREPTELPQFPAILGDHSGWHCHCQNFGPASSPLSQSPLFLCNNEGREYAEDIVDEMMQLSGQETIGPLDPLTTSIESFNKSKVKYGYGKRRNVVDIAASFIESFKQVREERDQLIGLLEAINSFAQTGTEWPL